MNTANNKSIFRSSNKNEVNSLNVPDVLYNNRYCNQDDFNVFIGGGRNNRNVLRNCFLINPLNFAESKEFPTLLELRWCFQAIDISSEIFVVIGGYLSKCVARNYAEMFLHEKKVWKVIDLPTNSL